jgi:hypothetical protein
VQDVFNLIVWKNVIYRLYHIGLSIFLIFRTHLNICAIFSCVGKHENAIEHAKLAINLLDIAKKSFISDQHNSITDSIINKSQTIDDNPK